MEAFFAVIYLLGGLAEFVLLGVLLARKQFRSYPIFTAYVSFNAFCDVLVSSLGVRPDHAPSMWAALILLPAQYLLELGVLLELGWHLLRPVRASLPANGLKIFAALMCLALAGGVLLAWHVDPLAQGVNERIKMPLDLTTGMLRMALFVTMAAFAQVLGIGWRDKVLRLATVLSFYSAVDLVVSLFQNHFGPSMTGDHLKGAAYFVELGCFVWIFTTKEVERKEISPQMQEFLVTLSGRVRETRSALARSQVK